jgi:hypothetical protein
MVFLKLYLLGQIHNCIFLTVAVTFENFNCFFSLELCPTCSHPSVTQLDLRLSFLPLYFFNYASAIQFQIGNLPHVGCTEGTHKGTIWGAGQFLMRQLVLIRTYQAVSPSECTLTIA